MILLERELAWRAANEKFEFYQPNGSIEKLIALAGSTDSKGDPSNLLYILSAANAIGKTAALVNLSCQLIFGIKNKFFDYPLFRDWSFPKRIRLISDTTQVEDAGPIPTEIEKWWPKGKYSMFRNGRHYNALYKANGWTLEVMTYNQQPKEFEGANIGLLLLNEPPPENLWTPNISRLRPGIAIIAMTPLTEAGWFFDKVAPRHEAYTIYADVEQACKQHGVRGHLDHDTIQRQVAEYDSDEKEARVSGKAMYLKGLIFKGFNPQVHVLSGENTVSPPANATIYHVVDPHEDKPFAMIWAFVDGRGDVYIWDEWPNQDFDKWHNCGLGIREYKNIIENKEQGITVYKRIIDRHFAEIRHMVGMTRKTLRDQFREVGLEFYPSYQALEEVESGVLTVRDYLKYNPDRPLDFNNKPKLFINSHCRNTIKHLSRWARDPKTGDVQDQFKDFCDVVRYLVSDNPKVDVPAPYTPPVKMW